MTNFVLHGRVFLIHLINDVKNSPASYYHLVVCEGFRVSATFFLSILLTYSCQLLDRILFLSSTSSCQLSSHFIELIKFLSLHRLLNVRLANGNAPALLVPLFDYIDGSKLCSCRLLVFVFLLFTDFACIILVLLQVFEFLVPKLRDFTFNFSFKLVFLLFFV